MKHCIFRLKKIPRGKPLFEIREPDGIIHTKNGVFVEFVGQFLTSGLPLGKFCIN